MYMLLFILVKLEGQRQRESPTYRSGGYVGNVGTTGQCHQLLLDLGHAFLSHVILVGRRHVVHDVLLVVREDVIDASEGQQILLFHVLIQVGVITFLSNFVLQRRRVPILFGFLTLL